MLIINMRIRIDTSRTFFNMMLDRVIHAPVNLYFDVTPVGRILGIFNFNLQAVEGILYLQFQEFLMLLINTFLILMMTVIVIPQMAIVLILMIYKCYSFFYYMKPAIKESERLAQSTGAPIFALSKQTFSGISIIRAFGKQGEFTQRFLDLLHQDILFYDLSLGVQAFNMW